MRLQSKHVRTLQNMLDELDEELHELNKASESWVTHVENKLDATYPRMRLERQLEKFRRKQAEVYDFMGDRGLKENGTLSTRYAGTQSTW